MADKKQNGNNSQIDALYQWISYDLQKIKSELMTELKLSSAQIGSLYGSIKGDKDADSSAMAQEIRYGYKQNQNIYEGLSSMIKNDVAARLNAIDEKLAEIAKLEEILAEISAIKGNLEQMQALYEGISATLKDEISPKLDKIVDSDEAKAIVEESVSVHTQEVLDAIGNIPAPEEVDYARITTEVGDKLLEILNDIKANEEPIPEIDYERVAGDTAAKVVESMPYVEPVDYDRINEAIAGAVDYDRVNEMVTAAVTEALNVGLIANVVAAAVNVDAIAEAVAARITPPEVDYDALAELVVDKLADKGISADIILDEEGVEKIAEVVADKVGCVENVDYDKIGCIVEAAQVPAEAVDYDRVAAIVEEKVACSCEEIEKVVTLDDEGIEKIVAGVADELRNMTLVCEYEEYDEAPAEEPAPEIVEEPVEEPAPEIVEEPVVEEEPIVEEPAPEIVEEPVVEEELAVAADPVYEEDMEGQLIDAETGLVVRLKRSFTAKMKQSEETVKVYYSDIKNELTSYKRINSNVSWHGDRFNFGRDTIAKIGINGKTLCVYLDLDPNDPELKTTVYHQKDVGGQKAYESTPFMIKVKSDAALKKAIRLVGILAAKLETEKEDDFVAVDYVAEFGYESTKQLFEEGYIKATKEKKVDFNF